MNISGKVILFGAVLALAACTNASGYGGGGSSGAGGSAVTGSVDDPRSLAYFQQAIGDRVFFEVDQSTLTDAARTVLQAQAEWLMANPDYRAIVEGHADEQGTREYNLALGARRANAAREFLVSRGVAENRIQTISYGKERPVEICSNESCYSKNRRAVTVLQSDLTG